MTQEQLSFWLKGYLLDKLSASEIETVISTVKSIYTVTFNDQLTLLGKQSQQFQPIPMPFYNPGQTMPTPGFSPNTAYCGDAQTTPAYTNYNAVGGVLSGTMAGYPQTDIC